MNKKVLIVATLALSMFTQAQEAASGDEMPKNKKGTPVLPQAGDIGLGFNATPLMDVVSNMIRFNQPVGAFNTNANQYVSNTSNMILGKYFLTDKSAVRVRLGINTLSGSMTNRIQDSKALYDASFGTQDEINAAQLIQVKDKATFHKTNWMITAGYEMRRGYKRLQGYYGGELIFGGSSANQQITYGNAFSDQYSVQYTNDFNTDAVTNSNPTANGRQVRNLETHYRGGFRFGARAFIGVEYFVFAKISIGAEYGWGWSYATRGRQTSKQEVYYNGQSGPNVVVEDVNQDSNQSTKGFSVDNNNNNPFSLNNTLNGNTILNGGSGAITVIFHF
jgi:hypothetical protein